MKLLIIEDEAGIGAALKRGLSKEYRVTHVTTGLDALEEAEDSHYDVVLLDLGLPDLSGLVVCQKLRKNGATAPILVLTGESDVTTKVKLLDSGANDYLTKPFHLEELEARLRVLLRHSESRSSNELIVGELRLDTSSRQLKRDGEAIQLRRKEYELLNYLMRHAGLVVTRTMILDSVWQSDAEPWANSIDVHIKNLRDKIDRPFARPYITTIYGLGYRFELPEAKLTATLPLREEVMKSA